MSDGQPREDKDSCFFYVVRDQYKDFKVLHFNFISKKHHQGLTS
jgi:hypothetical protein